MNLASNLTEHVARHDPLCLNWFFENSIVQNTIVRHGLISLCNDHMVPTQHFGNRSWFQLNILVIKFLLGPWKGLIILKSALLSTKRSVFYPLLSKDRILLEPTIYTFIETFIDLSSRELSRKRRRRRSRKKGTDGDSTKRSNTKPSSETSHGFM